jgi:uncharacterized protein YggU (UPF0235/DUF167 family)
MGERAGALRIAVTAAPEKGKANAAIQSVLADALGCKANAITLLSGETSRQKRFLIDGITVEELTRRLAALTNEPGLDIARREPRHRRGEGDPPRRTSEPASALGSHGGSPSRDVSNQPAYGIKRPRG